MGRKTSQVAEAIEKPVGARQRIMEELFWLAQPKSLDLPRALRRDENVGWQIDQHGIPTGKETACPFEAECEQPPLAGEAVIVERINSIGDVDVVAVKTLPLWRA